MSGNNPGTECTERKIKLSSRVKMKKKGRPTGTIHAYRTLNMFNMHGRRISLCSSGAFTSHGISIYSHVF